MNQLLTSCVEEPEAPQIEVNENAQIAQVKSWFEENKTKLRLSEKGSNFRSESQELILPFFEKEPDWDKFHHYYFPDGREVFEISLENATKYFPTSMADSFPDRNPAEVVIQNIMFVKHQSLDRFDPLIARYYPANSSNEKSFEEMNYQAIDYDWSGTLELFTYDEHHFGGFEIQDGELVRNYTYIPHDRDKTEGLRIMDMGCTTHYYPVGYKSCVDGYCTTTINYYIAETSCPGGGDLGASYSYGYGFPTGDSGSGGTANTDGNGTCSTCDYNPPTVPAPMKRLNCSHLKNTHGGRDKSIMEFRNRYYLVTYENIIMERGNVSITGLESQAGGPSLDYRYIQDPLNPSLIIDLRHLLVIGKFGRAVGESVEFLQYLAQYESAFDDQDYYSNELGYSFFQHYGEAVKRNPTATADYLVSFLANPNYRNSISSPERCRF